MDGAEDELIDKLLLQVIDDHALGTESQRLLLDLGEILNLAYIGKEGLEAVWVSIGSRVDPDNRNIRRRCNPMMTITLANN